MRILVTGGGTREYIDPVRFITNASSGRMGYALTEAAKQRQHEVTLISASDLQPPVGVEFVGVESAAEMSTAVKKFFDECDCLIMAAAVGDYTPVRAAKTKIKKTGKSFTIKLKPTTDILKWAAKHRKKNQIVVGFALEDRAVRARAEKKLRAKKLDMIVANTPDSIGSAKSTVNIKTPASPWLKIENATKASIARRIIRQVESLSARTKGNEA